MTLLHGSTLLTARTAFFISLRMARHLSSRQGAGAQEYGLYFKLLQRSIGGRDPAYAVAFDRCNGRYPSCSSQAARKWYGPCPWRGAFSRGHPSLWPRKNSFFFVTAFLMAISINRSARFVNGWFTGEGQNQPREAKRDIRKDVSFYWRGRRDLNPRAAFDGLLP